VGEWVKGQCINERASVTLVVVFCEESVSEYISESVSFGEVAIVGMIVKK
jgi:hypothetical protein